MTDLVSADEARLALRLGPAGDAHDDADLAMKITQASAIVLHYHSDGVIPDDWYDDSTSPAVLAVPALAKAAVLLVLHHLWDEREGDPIGSAYPVMLLLRGPGLA